MFRPIFRLFIFFVCTWGTLSAQQTYTLSGTIADSTNGETIIGAIVYVKSLGKGTTANTYGFYSLTLPEGTYDVSFSFISYETTTKRITLNKNVSLNLKFKPESTALKEVVVSAESSKEKEEVKSTQMGMISLPIEQIKHVPCIGGEVDIIKVMQLMPGIKRGGEGQTGMYVRGGDADQNLILVDEATVYNVSHLFGFFSVFNNDALKDVMIYKGGFPASYGGRLSAVMDIRMKEGDMQKYHVDGGIGLLSSHLTVQGPIIKDTASFIISGRRSYIDQVFKLAYGKSVLPYYFYDINAKVNYKITNRDRIYLSSYIGDDVLAFKQKADSSLLDFGFYLGNITGTLRWNHLYKNDKLFSNVSLIYTRFRYDVHGDFANNSVLVKSSIMDLGGKADYNYYKTSENKFMFGGSIVNHSFRPNVVSTSGEISQALASQEGGLLSTQEMAIYGLNDRSLNARWNINYGGRISFVNANGTSYGGFEPRLSATRVLTETQSLKFGLSRMIQYMHLVSSSSIALPTDLWYQGANLILNNNFEDEIVSGKGAASGIELFLNKTAGRFNGWIGYTLSVSTRKFEDLNNGKEYYAKYDRRHDWSFVVNYELSKRWSVSAVWVYSSGLRFTPVVGNYFMPNAALTGADIFPVYTDRNAVQLPASHRLDINFVLKSKEHKHWKSELFLGAYNFYNRAQPYQIRITGEGSGYKYQAVGLFGFIPSIGFNFSF
ncbi:MAG: TonB-dependent receptor [Bacteroidetes bacterium]|nr:TonB-dependent receptor [Bacteroidota bacterium]